MRFLSADIIFSLAPLSEPNVKGTLVLEDDGTIEEVIPYRIIRDDLEVLEGVLCPGFINAHTHLELSHFINQIPEKTGIVDFILNLQKLRSNESNHNDKFSEGNIQVAISKAYSFMLSVGIVGFGDISNSQDSFSVKSTGLDSSLDSRLNLELNLGFPSLRSHTFLEGFSFNPKNAETAFYSLQKLAIAANSKGLVASMVPHAPYSVSKELFDLIRQNEGGLISIHNQESNEENLFFESFKGDFLRLYRTLSVDISFFKPSGKPSLETYLPLLGSQKKLLVHNTFTSEEEVSFAKSKNTYWCLCPGANLFIEGTLPNLNNFYPVYDQILIGTDSLASNNTLSILEELKHIHAHFPAIGLHQLLIWACRNGADFFDWKDLGSFEKGKKPGVLQLTGLGSDLSLEKETQVKRII